MRLCLLLLLVLLAPQEPRESRPAETVRYREFSEIVAQISREAAGNEKALVVWLVDNSKMLKSSKHGEMLADAIQRSFKKSKIFHAVVAFGERPQLVQKPTDDPGKAASAIEALANAPPDDAIKNCLANVREAAKLAAGFSGGKKYLVLFTQENGDSEDDVESTLKFLKNGGVQFFPIAPEAVYSDPYWESAYTGSTYFFDMDKIRKLPFQLRGPESAFIEFPYGWPFTWIDPAYTVPSGFGYYALQRLATHSGGKYFLYSVDRNVQPFCQRYGCALCGGQHKACGATYDETKLKIVGPEVGSRADYGARFGKDKLYIASLEAWERLHKEGILRGAPPLRASGAGLSENKRSEKPPPDSPLMGGTEWKALRASALRSAADVEKIASELHAAEEKHGKEADLRALATTDALIIHLKVLAQSFKQLAAFADEMERARTRKPAPSDGFSSSELETPAGARPIGFGWTDVYLCHGGAPLKDLRFLGDLKELHATFDLADRMIEKHRGTPWEILIRRAYLPIFTPVFETGKPGQRERPPKPSSSTAQTETPSAPARPTRPTQGGQSGGAGTTTGGK